MMYLKLFINTLQYFNSAVTPKQGIFSHLLLVFVFATPTLPPESGILRWLCRTTLITRRTSCLWPTDVFFG